MDTVPGFMDVALDGGDRLIGRGGASDDKAPLMAMAFAFLESHVERGGTLVLAAVVQEEGESLGTSFLVSSESAPRPSFIIVGEPTGIDRVVTKYRGGSVRLRIAVETRGGGHASNPDFASNAILIAMKAYGGAYQPRSGGSGGDTRITWPRPR